MQKHMPYVERNSRFSNHGCCVVSTFIRNFNNFCATQLIYFVRSIMWNLIDNNNFVEFFSVREITCGVRFSIDRFLLCEQWARQNIFLHILSAMCKLDTQSGYFQPLLDAYLYFKNIHRRDDRKMKLKSIIIKLETFHSDGFIMKYKHCFLS